MNQSSIKFFCVWFCFLIIGCQSTPESSQAPGTNQPSIDIIADERDPFESVNRKLWNFNWDTLDKYILRPVTVIYVDWIPQGVRTGLLNMALNLEEPIFSVNNALQGHFKDAGISLSRFLINSSVGVLGVMDVAETWDLSRKDEEFGEVLGNYGVGQGPFLMFPARGPTDLRNMVGDAVDSSYLLLDLLSTPANIARMGIVVLETRASLRSQESMLENAVDPYSLVKDIYWQKEELKFTEHLSQEELDALEDDQYEEDIDAMLEDL